MSITEIGPWILVGTGVLLALASIYIVVVQQRKPVTLLTFGLLFAGVGTYGPAFLGDAAKFARVMLQFHRQADSDAYRMVLEAIGQGDLDHEYQEIAIDYVLSRPGEDIDVLLDQAIESASNEQGREALEEAQREYAEKVAKDQFHQEMLSAFEKMDRQELLKLMDPIFETRFEKELQAMKVPPKPEP